MGEQVEGCLPRAAVELEDDALVVRIGQRDGDALAELYHRHGTAMFAYLCRLVGDRHVAEEVLQDTFLGIWRSPSFEGRSSVRLGSSARPTGRQVEGFAARGQGVSWAACPSRHRPRWDQKPAQWPPTKECALAIDSRG